MIPIFSHEVMMQATNNPPRRIKKGNAKFSYPRVTAGSTSKLSSSLIDQSFIQSSNLSLKFPWKLKSVSKYSTLLKGRGRIVPCWSCRLFHPPTTSWESGWTGAGIQTPFGMWAQLIWGPRPESSGQPISGNCPPTSWCQRGAAQGYPRLSEWKFNIITSG